jgi:hypothetical protein
MYATVARNLGKRKKAEPWMLQTTTAYRPGEQSIAETTLTQWRKDALPNPERWLVDHREARGRVDVVGPAAHAGAVAAGVRGRRRGVDGPGPRVYREMTDPTECEDEATAARYFLNRAMAGADAWIAKDVAERQSRVETVAPGESVALGFDGSLNDDSTVLIASSMSDGFLFPVGIWAKPEGPEAAWWEVPRSDVLAAIREAFDRYDVARCYMDPHEWRSDVDDLAEAFPERVLAWPTSRDTAMAAALDRLHAGLRTGEVWHSGDATVLEHFGNAYVRKEHPQSGRKGGHRLVRKEAPAVRVLGRSTRSGGVRAGAGGAGGCAGGRVGEGPAGADPRVRAGCGRSSGEASGA